MATSRARQPESGRAQRKVLECVVREPTLLSRLTCNCFEGICIVQYTMSSGWRYTVDTGIRSIESRHAVLDLPDMIEHMPTYSADEVARRPDDTATRPARWYFAPHCRRQRLQGRLVGLAQLGVQVICRIRLTLPGQ